MSDTKTGSSDARPPLVRSSWTFDPTDEPPAGDPLANEEVITARRRFARRFRASRSGVLALCVICALILVAVLAPWLTPHDPSAQSLRAVLERPSGAHWFGTDELGRDVFSRLISATRISMIAAGQATLVAMSLGVLPGLVSGYRGGLVDTLIMRVTDAVMSFPPLILAIAIVGVLGPSLTNAMLAVGVVFAPRFVRVVRGAALSVSGETYVEASQSIGTPTTRIVRRHVLPNVLSPLVVQASLTAGFAMLAEASLSFLGLGVQPPDASWGAMLGRAFRFYDQAPWLVIFPGVAIVLAVLAFNVFGDALRDSIGRETRRVG